MLRQIILAELIINVRRVLGVIVGIILYKILICLINISFICPKSLKYYYIIVTKKSIICQVVLKLITYSSRKINFKKIELSNKNKEKCKNLRLFKTAPHEKLMGGKEKTRFHVNLLTLKIRWKHL